MKREDLGRLFTSFRHSAFRLETLPEYDVTEDDEAQAFRRWREGQPDPARNQERAWPKLVQKATAAGKSMERVRVLRRPLTDYQRFEFTGYVANVEAGEDIRILELGPGEELPWLPDYDFWIFDAVTVVRMEYDHKGRFIRPVDASEHVRSFVACQHSALARAVPFSDYRTRV